MCPDEFHWWSAHSPLKKINWGWLLATPSIANAGRLWKRSLLLGRSACGRGSGECFLVIYPSRMGVYHQTNRDLRWFKPKMAAYHVSIANLTWSKNQWRTYSTRSCQQEWLETCWDTVICLLDQPLLEKIGDSWGQRLSVAVPQTTPLLSPHERW